MNKLSLVGMQLHEKYKENLYNQVISNEIKGSKAEILIKSTHAVLALLVLYFF